MPQRKGRAAPFRPRHDHSSSSRRTWSPALTNNLGDVPASTRLTRFSMRDEARNTASHFSTWASGTNLRLRPVTFVSAGFARPLDDNAAASIAGDGANTPFPAQNTESDHLKIEVELVSDPDDRTVPSREVSSSRNSSDASDGSDDVILFKGRKWIAAQKASTTTIEDKTSDHAQSVPVRAHDRSIVQLNPSQAAQKNHSNEMVDNPTHDWWVPDKQYMDTLGDTNEACMGMSGHESDAIFRGHDEGDESDEAMVADVDDRTLAQLFSGLEGRGIGFDEPDFSSDSTGRVEYEKKLSQPRPVDTSEPNHCQEDSALNEQAVAEAFGELALTGSGQAIPEPRRSARLRKQPPIFNVSDSELESAMQSAWTNDRERKKNRKLTREGLRQQGLLGNNANLDDLRIKYQDGMKLEDVKHELKGFLMGHEKTLQFPPMDKHARRILHELAHKFRVKSKSVGTGDGRRPVLCRTKGTLAYPQHLGHEAERRIDEASLRIHRKFFPRMDKIDRSGKSKPARSGQGAMTYRDGEIVGATAPQIGEGNKGHAMLEKMGWTNGMALGTADNKGILEPVAQVVKRSKAGLG